MARQIITDHRLGGVMAVHGIYQACFQGWFQAGVEPPSAVSSKQYEFGTFHSQLYCHSDDAIVVLICCVNFERAT